MWAPWAGSRAEGSPGRQLPSSSWMKLMPAVFYLVAGSMKAFTNIAQKQMPWAKDRRLLSGSSARPRFSAHWDRAPPSHGHSPVADGPGRARACCRTDPGDRDDPPAGGRALPRARRGWLRLSFRTLGAHGFYRGPEELSVCGRIPRPLPVNPDAREAGTDIALRHYLLHYSFRNPCRLLGVSAGPVNSNPCGVDSCYK